MEEKEVITADFQEVKEKEKPEQTGAKMEDICAKCAHHGFCKYESNCQKTLDDLAEKIKAAELEHFDPFVVFIQCKGFIPFEEPKQENEAKEK